MGSLSIIYYDGLLYHKVDPIAFTMIAAQNIEHVFKMTKLVSRTVYTK